MKSSLQSNCEKHFILKSIQERKVRVAASSAHLYLGNLDSNISLSIVRCDFLCAEIFMNFGDGGINFSGY